jgi:2-keto-4-pentenoate hydratase/2-oxohepta-3-ene-1,7-dioic acid hydratase in catechol pathway
VEALKIVRFSHPKSGAPVYGIIEGDSVELVKGEVFKRILKTGESFSLSAIQKYLPPVYPPNIIAIGLNYYTHAEEGGYSIPEEPAVFLKATSSIIGHRESIILPKTAPHEVDYEGELAVIIGKKGKNIDKHKTLEHILGYTCGNDVSARDCQLKRDIQWTRGKSFDTFCPLGPWIETDFNASEARLQTRVNNNVLQKISCGDMIFSVEDLVSFLSRCMTLLPGTIIMTGTPGGVGFTRNPPIFLKKGYTIEINIDLIGTLENHVILEI